MRSTKRGSRKAASASTRVSSDTCAKKKIHPEKAAAQIKKWGGTEKTYNQAKTDSSQKEEGSIGPQKIKNKFRFDEKYLYVKWEKKHHKKMLNPEIGDERTIRIRCDGYQGEHPIWGLVNTGKVYDQGSLKNNNDDVDEAA